MTERVKKRVRRQSLNPQYFIFEIKTWEPSYSFSVDMNRDRAGPYREHVGIELECACIHPVKMVGRDINVHVVGERDCLEPAIYKSDPDWRPRCVGALHLPPTRGNFYTSIPHDSFPVFLTALAHGLFRFMLLWGPPLSRGKSLCGSIEWARSVDLEDC